MSDTSSYTVADKIVGLDRLDSHTKGGLICTNNLDNLRRGTYLSYLDKGYPHYEELSVLADAVVREHAKREAAKDPLPPMPYAVTNYGRHLADANGDFVAQAPHQSENVNGPKGVDTLHYFAKCGTVDVRAIVDSGCAAEIAKHLMAGTLYYLSCTIQDMSSFRQIGGKK